MVQSGGIATTAQLLRVFTRRTVERAVSEGLIERVERGRYGLPEVGAARVHAHRLGGVLALTSAALEWGWPVKTGPTSRTSRSIPGGTSRPPAAQGST